MIDKNNLDDLFKERFDGFQETPDERVWKSIEASLDKRQKRRRAIPLWWKLAGAAAVFIGLMIFLSPFQSTDELPEGVTDVETEQPISVPEQDNMDSNRENFDPGTTEVTGSDQDVVPGEGQFENRTVQSEETYVSSDESSGQIETPNTQKATIENSTAEKTTPESGLAVSDKDSEKINPKSTIQNQALAVNEADSQGENPVDTSGDLPQSKNNVSGEEDGVTVAVEEAPEETVEDGKRSIYEVLEEQEEEALADASQPKWSVGPSVAPVYFNSMGEGSPIHSNFASNSKSGNVNMSYGVTVAYEINRKLKIRSGVHRVDYGYDTNEITFSSSLVATSSQFNNIDYSATSRTLVVKSNTVGRGVNDPVEVSDIVAQSPTREGRMVQEFGYLEVPLELNYALLDKKFGVQVIGGLSSLFLVDNSVSLESVSGTTEMGEANNINDLNFSTNLGLGFNYRMNPSMNIFLEPMFKYQLNTFSDAAGNFRPYTVGVYTGLNFRF